MDGRLYASNIYPEAYAILQEAESQATTDGDAQHWLAQLYARGGYLDDAARAFKSKEPFPDNLFTAQVLYGNAASVESFVRALPDTESRAFGFTRLADIYWRMGNLRVAEEHLEAAKRIATKTGDARVRQKILTLVERGYSYMTEMPPQILSASPQPKPRAAAQEPDRAVAFPITPEGLIKLSPDELTAQNTRNAALLEKLYAFMAAGDRNGLQRLSDSARDPFQKTLVMASIEHLLLQAREWELAEQFAKSIPETSPQCALAKAEALSAAASGWLGAGSLNRANADFDLAADLARSLKTASFGKVSAAVAIARAQAGGGLTASAGASLKAAQKYAEALPLKPASARKNDYVPIRNSGLRAEAYSLILLTSIAIHDLGAGRDVARAWAGIDTQAYSPIADAWFQAGQTGEALTFVRNISDQRQKVMGLQSIAQNLLDEAGAPAI